MCQAPALEGEGGDAEAEGGASEKGKGKTMKTRKGRRRRFGRITRAEGGREGAQLKRMSRSTEPETSSERQHWQVTQLLAQPKQLEWSPSDMEIPHTFDSTLLKDLVEDLRVLRKAKSKLIAKENHIDRAIQPSR